MKVKVIRTGNVMHVDRHWLIGVMIEAGLLEEVHDAPAPLPEPNVTWQIGYGQFTGISNITGTCPRCRQSEVIAEHPEKYKGWAHCGKIDKIPADVLEAFAKTRTGS